MGDEKTLTENDHLLGDFQVEHGDAFVISDPCYGLGTWCAGEIPALRPGTWEGYIRAEDQGWGVRPTIVAAIHRDVFHSLPDDLGELERNWNDQAITVGVDSGQAGIFVKRRFKDDSCIKDDELGDICQDEPWYSACCKLTLGPMSAGIVPANSGVVASSNFGDGTYRCYAIVKNNEVVAVLIDFGAFDRERQEQEEICDGCGRCCSPEDIITCSECDASICEYCVEEDGLCEECATKREEAEAEAE